MKVALHKVRLEYQQDYEKFILKIETESAEVGLSHLTIVYLSISIVSDNAVL